MSLRGHAGKGIADIGIALDDSNRNTFVAYSLLKQDKRLEERCILNRFSYFQIKEPTHIKQLGLMQPQGTPQDPLSHSF